MTSWDSPFIVPLGAFAVAIVAIVAGAFSSAHSRRIKSEQRMALLARGVPPLEIEKMLDGDRNDDPRVPSSPTRRMGTSRRTAMVLISVGLGVMLFGLALTVIVRDREVLTVAAAGLIPLAIGLGFLTDYTLQRREMELLGMETERLLR